MVEFSNGCHVSLQCTCQLQAQCAVVLRQLIDIMVPVPPQVFAFVMNAAEFKLGCRGSIFAPKISGYKLLRCAEKSSFTHRRVGAPQNGECMMLKCIFTSDDSYVLPPLRRLRSTSTEEATSAEEAMFYLHRGGYILLPPRRLSSTSTEKATFYCPPRRLPPPRRLRSTSAEEAIFYLRRGGYVLPPLRRLCFRWCQFVC